MQFQVPQNIDLEDKIVGPLTLTQFLYLLGGGLIDYILFQSLGRDYFALFVVIGVPIALLALGLAFLKIQDQPLSNFVSAGLVYLSRPKIRLWQRLENYQPILVDPPKIKKKEEVPVSKKLDKSQLEQLAYTLDTSGIGIEPPAKQAKFGQITEAFEKILKEKPVKINPKSQAPNPNARQ